MSPDSSDDEHRKLFKGSVGLIVAIAVVTVVSIASPAYRWLIVISIGICFAIGVVAAGILSLWHRLRPLKEGDIENKRPLGLN